MNNLSNYPPGVTGQEDAITGGDEEATESTVNLIHQLVGVMVINADNITLDSIDTTYGLIDVTVDGKPFTISIVENLS